MGTDTQEKKVKVPMTVAEIVAITDEKTLLESMREFEKSLEVTVRPIEDLLKVDVRSKANSELSLEEHMSALDARRQSAERMHALCACFLEFAKSEVFALKKKDGYSELDRRQKEKFLVAPFEGLSARTAGLVKSIDSRVNLCKILLRLADERVSGSR